MAPTSLHPKVNHTKTNHENDWNWREVKTVITGIWLMGKKAGKKGLSLKILQGVFPLPHYANLQDTRPTIQTRSLWLLCRALWYLKGQKKPVIFEGTKEAWDCGTKQNSCKRTFFDGQVCISGWKDEAIIAPSQEFTVLSLPAMIKEPFCYKNAPKTCGTVSVDCRPVSFFDREETLFLQHVL